MGRNSYIIIDPAQVSPHSHNYEYNKVLSRQAAAAGYDVVLLINAADASDFSSVPAKVKRVFRHSIHDWLPIQDMWRSTFWRRVNTARNMLVRRVTTVPNLTFFTVYPDVARVLSFIGRALVVVFSPVLHLLNYVFDRIVQRSRPFHRDQFAAFLANYFSKYQCKPGDRIIMHSATPAMVESLFELRARMGIETPLPAHGTFVFHHSLSEPDVHWWYLQYYQVGNLRWMRKRWESGSPFRTGSFHALTSPLTDELREDTGLPVTHIRHFLDDSLFKALLGSELAIVRRDPGSPASIGIRASDLGAHNSSHVLDMVSAVKQAAPNVQFKLLCRNPGAPGLEAMKIIGAVPDLEILDTNSSEAFLRALSGLDMLVMPYEPEAYKMRVSGVQLECAAVGAAVLAPAGTTLTADDAPARVYSFARPQEMAAAVLEFIAQRTEAGFEEARQLRAKQDQKIAFRTVIDELAPTDAVAGQKIITVDRYGPVATVVSPLWGRCGSSTVFDAETEYLLDRGYYIARIMVAQWRLLPCNTAHVFTMMRENSARVKPHLFLVASRDRWRALFVRFTQSFRRSSAFGQDAILIGTSVDHDKQLANYFFENSEIAVVNHSFHGRYLKRFQRAKVVLETQDIQAYQYRIRNETNRATGRLETIEDWTRDEAEVWKAVDACVNLSQDEQNVIRRYAPNSHMIRPLMETRALAAKRTWPQFVKANQIHESHLDIKSYDFMLWGDLHQSNVNSTRWFIENVSLHREFKGCRTFICGRVGGQMLNDFGVRPGLYFAGFLDNLDEAILRSKLLVLPDQMGSGISVKTLDTLSTGRPFVATTIALRSLDLEGIAFQGVKTAVEMRADCKRLLGSEAAMEERAKIGRAIHARNMDRSDFYARWDRVLQSVGLIPTAAAPARSHDKDGVANTAEERADVPFAASVF